MPTVTSEAPLPAATLLGCAPVLLLLREVRADLRRLRVLRPVRADTEGGRRRCCVVSVRTRDTTGVVAHRQQ